MVMHLNKPMAVVVIVVLLGLGVLALIFGQSIAGSTRGSATSTSVNKSQVSSTGITAGDSSSTVDMGMNVLPAIRLVPLGGSASFSVVLYNGGDLTGNYSLSAAAPPGLSFRFGATPIAFSGAGAYSGELNVTSSREMSPGEYNVTIVATGSKGAANETFDFHVQRNLVLLHSTDSPFFSNLTVKAGDSVTWVALDAANSDNPLNGWHQVIFSNIVLTSGNLRQYASWSHTFTQPGIYRYYDNADLTITGEVIVSP